MSKNKDNHDTSTESEEDPIRQFREPTDMEYYPRKVLEERKAKSGNMESKVEWWNTWMALNKKDVAMLRKLKVKFEVAPKGYNLSAPSCPFISDVERVVGVRSRGEEVLYELKWKDSWIEKSEVDKKLSAEYKKSQRPK